MKQLSPDDRLVLDRLLTQLAGRLDGAIDFWTLVCLGNFPDGKGFLLKNSEALRSLVIVIGGFLPELAAAKARLVHTLLEQMGTACQRLQNAFLVLQQFRIVRLDEVRAATDVVVEVHANLRQLIWQLGEALGLSISYWKGRTPEREEYIRKILAGLYNQFAHEVQTGELAAALPFGMK
jgi:hypothetical protein